MLKDKLHNYVFKLNIMKKITIILGVMILSSCGMSRLTQDQVKHRNTIDYELDKLYLEYSYQRDSLIMEFYKK